MVVKVEIADPGTNDQCRTRTVRQRSRYLLRTSGYYFKNQWLFELESLVITGCFKVEIWLKAVHIK